MRKPVSTVSSVIAASILAVVLLSGFGSQAKVEAAGAALGFPTVTCTGSSATAVFSWQALPTANQQWVDLSVLDNGFAPGTFSGRLSDTSTLTWTGLEAGKAYLWRVNTLTPAGWVPSATGAFVTCGNPVLLGSSQSCTGIALAAIDVRWAPVADLGATQYLDLSSTAEFAPGTFIGSSPLSAAVGDYHWPNVQSNVLHFFRVNTLGSDGVWHTSATGYFDVPCLPQISPDLYGSGDYLVGPGISANVNIRDVGFDGLLGDPAGPWDVVRYNFGIFANLNAYPGVGGTTLISGHVDYHDCGGGIPCLSVFAPLRNSKVGDRFTYYRWDGGVVNYVVDWAGDFPPDYDWTSLMGSAGPDQLILLTCNGQLDRAAREYSQRRLVHMVRAD